MSCNWVCASCRRSLQQQTRRSRSQNPHRTASFTPFRGEPEAQKDNDSTGRKAPRPRRRPPGYIDWQFDRSVETDFVQRISESRERGAGPYSKDKRRHSSAAEEQGRNPTRRPEPARVYRRNGVPQRAHPLDLEEPTRRKRPWFGIPSGHTALADLGHLVDPNTHRSLTSSLSFSSCWGANEADAPPAYLHTQPSQPSQPNGQSSFFDQYFEQARTTPAKTNEPSPVQEALEKLQTAHELSVLPSSSKSAGRQESASHSLPTLAENETLAIGSDPSVQHQEPLEGSPLLHDPTSETDNSPASLSRAQQSGLIPSETWKLFLNLSSSSKKSLNRSALRKLCHGLVDAYCAQGAAATRVPKPARLLQTVNQDLNLAQQTHTSIEVLWTVLAHAVSRSTSDEVVNSPTSLQELVDHTLELWRGIFSDFAECYSRDVAGIIQQTRGSSDWATYLSSEQMVALAQNSQMSAKAKLLVFFPESMHPSLETLDTAALVTWSLLRHRQHANASLKQQHAPPVMFEELLNKLFAGHAIPLSPHKKVLTKRCLQKSHAESMIDSLALLTRGQTRESRSDHGVGNQKVDPRPSTRTEARSSAEPSVETLDQSKKRISRAVESQDLVRLETIYRQLQTHSWPNQSANQGLARISPQIYAHLLTAFMALSSPGRAIEVWNRMTNEGVEPSVEHWDAMLKGCGISRNADAAQIIWERLRDAGVRPDVQLWTTRIHALGSSGRIEAAVEAFETMAREWSESQSSKQGSSRSANARKGAAPAPKPNTQCLNTLVSVLARANRHSQLVKVLAWRKRLGIPADSFTFNPLLRAALRDGDVELGSKILQQMSSAGVEPDVATFTLLLNSLFQQQNSAEDTPVEARTDVLTKALSVTDASVDSKESVDLPSTTSSHQSIIGTVFGLMAQHSTKPTAHTFTTLVTGLLRSNPPNTTAAYAIVHYLGNQEQSLSPQLYTALTSHHFEQTPPELEAVDALWQDANRRRKAKRPLILDAFFYDRFVEGWSRCGYPSRALEVYRTAKARGRSVSWSALQELVDALARVEDWQSAQAIVNELKAEAEAVNGSEKRSRKGWSSFWSAMQALNLAEGASVSTASAW